MRKFFVCLLTGLFLLFFLGCEKKPTACPTCKGTGKITQSNQAPIPFNIVNHRLIDKGILNPDYFLDVSIENKGEKDGSFRIYVDFIYKEIGKHTEQSELFVGAHSTATKTIRYDADKRADSYEIRIEPPFIIQTTESICPTCKGKGFID